MTSPFVTPSKRAVFVDVLRLLAAVQMIQGHTLDALLAPSFRSGAGFVAWTFSRGLTSTTFLFTAGLSFVLASRAARDPAAARRRRMRRALELIVIGYLMHAPLAVLFGAEPRAAMAEFLSVDVLQCIGVSLLGLELLCWALGAWQLHIAAALLGATVLFALATAAGRVVPEGAWFGLTSYVSPSGGSLFPLVPWAGYVLCGLAVGTWVFRDGQARVAPRLVALSVPVLGLGWLLARTAPGADPRVAPAFLLVKLGLVLLVAGALAAALARATRLPGWLETLAGETLFLYVTHVLVLYAANVGVKARWGSTLGPGPSLLAALGLLVACSAGAFGYRRAERALRRAGTRGTSAP
jgi:acyltransferase